MEYEHDGIPEAAQAVVDAWAADPESIPNAFRPAWIVLKDLRSYPIDAGLFRRALQDNVKLNRNTPGGPNALTAWRQLAGLLGAQRDLEAIQATDEYWRFPDDGSIVFTPEGAEAQGEAMDRWSHAALIIMYQLTCQLYANYCNGKPNAVRELAVSQIGLN